MARIVLKRTVAVDGHCDNLSETGLSSESNEKCLSGVIFVS